MSVLQKKIGSVFRRLGYMGKLNWMSDELYLKLKYWSFYGKMPDFENPRTFNEKLQWLKLHDHNPLYCTLVDKYAVKQWVADRIGPEYVTETYARWDCAEDIDISGLPERFVLKTNHDCGGIAICRDRSSFDLEAARTKLAKHLRTNYFWGGREWPYKDVRPCVFAEEYLEPDVTDGLSGYKLFRFTDGRIVTPLAIDRFTEAGLTKTFFDEEWKPLPLSEGGRSKSTDASVPACFDEMMGFVDHLAEGFPFVRVDFYESVGHLLFGEMTLCPNSDFEHFVPEGRDAESGSWIDLSHGGWLLVNKNALMWIHGDSATTLIENGLTDYKFLCFDGDPRYAFTCTGRSEGNLRVDFFDSEWKHLPFTRHYPNADVPPVAPRKLREMQSLSRALSDGIPFVRVDFYEQEDRILFGEMTFYPGSGFEEFDPEEWDVRLGEMIALPRFS